MENPSLSGKYFTKKALQQIPKGWKCLGSPDRTIFATFA